jgi:hypothetical protein
MRAVMRAWRPELCVALGLALLLGPLGFFISRQRGWSDFAVLLNAESFNVARALVDGRGFSDPFAEPSGPTAWVAPLYTLLLAGLLLVFKTKGAVVTAIIVLMNLTAVATGVSVYAICRRASVRLSPLVALAGHVAWILVYWDWYFEMTTDVWLVTLLLLPMLWAMFLYLQDGLVRSWRWGALAGTATLVSPALASAWVGTGVVTWVRTRRQAPRWLAAAGIAALISAPWSLRNLQQFGRFIPTKSNLGFEAYLANVVDDDGIYDVRTMRLHPYSDERIRFDFCRSGESEYIARHQAKFLQSVRQKPQAILRRVAQRALAATLWYAPNLEASQHAWLKRLLFALPVPLVCAALVLRRHPHRRALSALGLFWGLYLLPYVLIAFYSRYVMPLAPLLIIASFLALDGFATLRRREPGAASG